MKNMNWMGEFFTGLSISFQLLGDRTPGGSANSNPLNGDYKIEIVKKNENKGN
jgi:hypothetical protein